MVAPYCGHGIPFTTREPASVVFETETDYLTLRQPAGAKSRVLTNLGKEHFYNVSRLNGDCLLGLGLGLSASLGSSTGAYAAQHP